MQTRLNAIERSTGKGQRMFVTRDDGATFEETGTSNPGEGGTFTRAEIDEIGASGFEVVVFHVVRE